MTELTALQMEQHRSMLFKPMTATQWLDAASLVRFNAAVGANEPSPMAHWTFFREVPHDDELGSDGHPRRGVFLPDIPELPRRMFASSSIDFRAPLAIGQNATLTQRMVDLRQKVGRSGALVFVDVERVIEQAGVSCVTERQTLVYRPAAGARPSSGTPNVATPEQLIGHPAYDDGATASVTWLPGSANLFRFSAATFNSHRIHYDQAYTVDVEGYPDLVVHGPFIAAKLAQLAARRGPIATFEFRISAPCFVDRPVRLIERKAGDLQAVRNDGVVAVAAQVIYR